MKKLPDISAFLIISTVFLGTVFLMPETANGWVGGIVADGVAWLIQNVVFKIASLITNIGGYILNYSIQVTILDMAERVAKINSINITWRVVRDVANMSFIFILLYAAIKLLLGIGSDAKKTVVRVIIIAILINFSLLATKLVIDASNLMALVFYEAAVPSSTTKVGLSEAIVEGLNISTLHGAGTTQTVGSIIAIGIMGTIFLVITGFVFFAMAILLVIRFAILIIVMIMAPLAFMGFVLPGLKKYWDQWWNALSGQAFFAPIFMLFMWIIITIVQDDGFLGMVKPEYKDLATGLTGSVAADGTVIYEPGAIAVVLNFVIVIILLIVAIVVSKSWANKAGPAVSGATKWAMGVAGGASFGLAARGLRYTAGAGAEIFKESKIYKRLEAKPDSRMARLTLAAADKTRQSSFDVRGTRLGSMLSGAGVDPGTASGQGGIEAERKAVREFLEKPGTEAYKKRQERARKARTELSIKDNLPTIDEYSRLEAMEAAHTAGTGPALSTEQTARLTELRVTNPTTGRTKIDEMRDIFEGAINDATTKEIEAIIESNRNLLNSQEFANKISVQQLEAINKSDKFTESEKRSLKNQRFAKINNATTSGNAASVGREIRALSDIELEMIDPQHLKNVDFVSQLRPAQIDTINKSGRFTSSQRETLSKVRQQPIKKALTPPAGTPINPDEVKRALRELGPKEQAALMKMEGRPGVMVGIDPYVLSYYTPKMLRRMVDEMTPGDIQTLRAALVVSGERETRKWLNDNSDNFS
jgi:hypothetical protein